MKVSEPITEAQRNPVGLLVQDPQQRQELITTLGQLGFQTRVCRPERGSLETLLECCVVICEPYIGQKYLAELMTIKRWQASSLLPILILLHEAESAEPWLEMGFDGVLRQPVERRVLQAHLHRFIRMRSQSREIYRSVFENTQIGIYRTTPTGQILFANPALVKMMGFDSFQDLAAHNVDDISRNTGFDRQEFLERIQRDGRVLGMESVYARRDQTAIFVRENATGVFDEQGKLQYIDGTLEDLTEKKHYQDELHFQAHLLDSVGQAVIATDTSGRITYWNRAAEDLYGWKKAETLGNSVHSFIHATIEPDRVQELAGQMAHGLVEVGEFELQRRDGSRFPALVSHTPITDRSGRLEGVINVSVDISERKLSELESQRWAKQMQQLTAACVQVNRAESVESSLQIALEQAALLTGCSLALVYLPANAAGRKSYSAGWLADEQQEWKPVLDEFQAQNGIPLLLLDGQTSLRLTQSQLQQQPDYQRLLAATGLHASLNGLLAAALPSRHGQHYGVLQLSGKTAGEFTADDEVVVRQLVEVLALVIERQQLLDEVQMRLLELETVNQVSVSLRTAQTLEEMLPVLVGETQKVLNLRAVGLWLYDPRQDGMYLAHGSGWFADIPDGVINTHSGLTVRVLQGETVIIDEYLHDPTTNAAAREYIPAGWGGAGMPIRTQDEVVGTLFVSLEKPRRLSELDLKLLSTLSELAGNAISRQRLNDQTQQRAEQLAVTNNLVRTLAETLDEGELYERLDNAILRLVPEISAVIISQVDRVRETAVCIYASVEGEVLDARQLPSTPLHSGEQGPLWETVTAAMPVVINDFQAYTGSDHGVYRQAETMPGSVMFMPLVAKEQVLGVLQVHSPSVGRFSTEDANNILTVANTAAVAMYNSRLFTETRRRAEQQAALHTIDRAINSSLGVDVTMEVILDQVMTQLDVDAAAILQYNEPLVELSYSAMRGFSSSRLRRRAVRLGEGLPGRVALERRVLILPDPDSLIREWSGDPIYLEESFKAYCCVPLISKGLIKGVLELYLRRPLEADSDWFKFLEMVGDQAALAIDNAGVYNELQRSNLELIVAYDATIEGWSRALDLRDQETEGHSQRVTEMCLRLASALGIHGEPLLHIRRGALLHDIGKMGIPDQILLKPGPLTDEEWEVMRSHPVLAYNMLAPIKFLQNALDIPYCHHEKWDGSGYPQGLAGEQIPMPARIFAVVDVWDALNSDRPYRQAWPREKILAYMVEQRGKHFDPQILDVFLRLVQADTGSLRLNVSSDLAA